MIDYQLALFPQQLNNQDMMDVFRVLKKLEALQLLGVPVHENLSGQTSFLYVDSDNQLKLRSSDGTIRTVTLT